MWLKGKWFRQQSGTSIDPHKHVLETLFADNDCQTGRSPACHSSRIVLNLTRGPTFPTPRRFQRYVMVHLGKSKDKNISPPTAGEVEVLLGQAQEVYGLIKKAAASSKTGDRKRNNAELLVQLGKTAKGVVNFAVDQRRKHAAKKDLARRDIACTIPYSRTVRTQSAVPDIPTFQARFQFRGPFESIVVDAGPSPEEGVTSSI